MRPSAQLRAALRRIPAARAAVRMMRVVRELATPSSPSLPAPTKPPAAGCDENVALFGDGYDPLRARIAARRRALSSFSFRESPPAGFIQAVLSPQERAMVRISWIRPPPGRAAPGEVFVCGVELMNHSPHALYSFGPAPVNLAARWTGEAEGVRVPLRRVAPAGEGRRVEIRLAAPVATGPNALRIGLVQEGVAWFEPPNGEIAAPCEVAVGP